MVGSTPFTNGSHQGVVLKYKQYKTTREDSPCTRKKEYNTLRLVANFTSGIPFIVMGQLVSVFLDQKELLEEISDSLKKK